MSWRNPYEWQLKKAAFLAFPVQLAVSWASCCLYKPLGGALSVFKILKGSRALFCLLPEHWEPHFRKEHFSRVEIGTKQKGTPIEPSYEFHES